MREVDRIELDEALTLLEAIILRSKNLNNSEANAFDINHYIELLKDEVKRIDHKFIKYMECELDEKEESVKRKYR